MAPPEALRLAPRPVLQLAEQVKRLAVARGPGWSVAIRDLRHELVARLTLASYDQVSLFADGMADLGYDMTILEDGADFVFDQVERGA